MFRSPKLLAFISIAVLVLPSPVHADLVVSIENVTGPTSGMGTFEVLLSNNEGLGGPSFDVASFSFALEVSSGSGVQFAAAETATVSAPYIFDGTGGSSVDPAFTLSLDPFPNSSFAASDTEFTFPSIAVNPRDVFGLGLIAYSVSPGATGGDVHIAFISDGTSLSDAAEAGIDFIADDRGAVIHLEAVPEPSSLVLATLGAGLTLLTKGLRRRTRRELAD